MSSAFASKTVSQPDDGFEREADRLADRIMSKPASETRSAPKPAAAPGASSGSIPAGGHPLPASERAFFESRFGHDFSNVRVHADEPAQRAASAIEARAFTVGQSIVFGRGEYRPGTPSGRRTIAHELAHVVQPPPNAAVIARLPAPPRMAQRKPGLSQIGPIYKNEYTGNASTSINSGWAASSFERRWSLYDASDTLLDERFYTWPQPTYTIEPRFVTIGQSGESWSVWHEVTKTLNPFGESDPSYFPYDYVTFPVYDTRASHTAQTETPDEEEDRALGLAVPKGGSPLQPANTRVTPEVALEIIQNTVEGKPAFKPQLGKGGVSWFVTEGNPYTGIDPGKRIDINVELATQKGKLVFDEAKLKELLAKEEAATRTEAEAKFRELKGIDPSHPLSKTQHKALARFLARFAESRMWDRVGELVRNSDSKVGEVVLEEGSQFSRSGSGKFAVVADASKIRLKGGVEPIIQALEAAGAPVEPTVAEAAEALAKRQKWAGRVRGVFRHGGRILLVVAIANDVYKIYQAQDKLKAVLTSAGGWAGATAAGAAFAAWFTPADTAGPWAWAVHGVGTLVAVGVGYWLGSETVRYIYELVPVE